MTRFLQAIILVLVVVSTPQVAIAEGISDIEAVIIARKESRMDVPADSKPVIEREGDVIIVTFPTHLGSYELGSDYHARVTLDSKTGKVIQVLAG